MMGYNYIEIMSHVFARGKQKPIKLIYETLNVIILLL